MEPILIGSTDRSIFFFILDPVQTQGEGYSGLVAADFNVSYSRAETDNDFTWTDVTGSLNDLASITAAHADWGVIQINSGAPGLYRLDIADAVFAAGAWYAVVYIMLADADKCATPKEFQLVAYNPLDGVRLGLTALPNAAADAAGGLPISDAGGLDLDARIGTDIPAILVDTAEIGVAGAGLTNIDLPNQTMDITGNITGNLSGSVGSVTGAVGSVTGAVGSVTGNVGGTINGLTAVALKDFFDTDSTTTYAGAVAGSVVKEIADNAGGASLTVQDIVDGVWDEPIASHVDAGSTGEALDDASAGGDPAVIADAVWDEDATGHQTQGSFGQVLGDSGADTDTLWALANTNLNATVSSRASQTSVDDLPTNAELATALGTADDAVLAELAKVPKSDGTVTWNATAAAQLQSEAADALNAYDPPTRAEATSDANSILTAVADVPTNAELATALAAADDAVLAAIAALNNLSAAQVNAEVVDALATDTYVEPVAPPAATATLAAKIAWLAVLARNKVTQTATTQTLRNDADSGDIATAAVSDTGTTFTRAEWT